MARARTIKPGFFINDQLGELEPWERLLFAGLWTLADRDGRLLDRPKRIKSQVLPYDSVDVDLGLARLAERGFLARYEADEVRCIQILTFTRHQHTHPREDPSELPPPPGAEKPDLGPAMHAPANGQLPGMVRPEPGDELAPGMDRLSRASSSSSSSSSRTSSSRERARAPDELVDDEFKLELEDEFFEALGTRAAVQTSIAKALAHKSRLEYSDLRPYLRSWVLGDVERAQNRRQNGHGGSHSRASPGRVPKAALERLSAGIVSEVVG
jgi:hypothetical protein